VVQAAGGMHGSETRDWPLGEDGWQNPRTWSEMGGVRCVTEKPRTQRICYLGAQRLWAKGGRTCGWARGLSPKLSRRRGGAWNASPSGAGAVVVDDLRARDPDGNEVS